ncbi:caspase-8-like isoform X2 [Haliotis rufescens]|nr:caspase-8-like isoform X2 [Haliotis rufescens]XP_048250427.1 caspase-8-like isoform X2 [Haliotis rufescens]XP_048250428.1 caspase-8-like isoform X2 [Haliotis rufescens]XP_048250429.1 caspase-8-like isoform X2 [Haliotis rufescens]XP_048250430.1 caspase-8-like isoform X2 [Haliotis rufescens]
MAGGGFDADNICDLIEDSEPFESLAASNTSPEATSTQIVANRDTATTDIAPNMATQVTTTTSRTDRVGKSFDAALVYETADEDLAEEIFEEMNQLCLTDGTAVDVRLFTHPCFGADLVQRPGVIASKCRLVLFLHTCNMSNDRVAEFTRHEAIAQIRIHENKDYVRSLRTDKRLKPLDGLKSQDALDWIKPVTLRMKQKVKDIITWQRRSPLAAEMSALTIKHSDDRCYEMMSEPRGLCVILNIVHFDKTGFNRHAAAGANAKLKTLFEDLKFKVWSYTDNTKKEIEKILEDAGKYMDDNATDCFVVFISSHGREGVIYSKDLQRICIKDIARQFRPDKCPNLKGKPKLFFIDACRKYDFSVSCNESCGDIEDIEDFFFCYAAQPGESSIRNNETGDVFTDEFIKVMTELSGSDHLADIMTVVTRRVKGRKVVNRYEEWQGQFPDVSSKLTKKLYFR